jgi:RNA polymerase sigma-70 factor (ECF subfamily)
VVVWDDVSLSSSGGVVSRIASDQHRGRVALEDFQPYLELLAANALARRLSRSLKGKISASDVVQDTLLRAHEKLDQLQGQSPPQVAGWLRTILASIVSNRIRDLRRQRRGGGREQSLESALEDSAIGIERLAAPSQSSPTKVAEWNEDVLRVAQAIARLPDAQRQAILLRHFRDWDVLQIARHLGRTPRGVAGLLRRGREALRKELDGPG